MKQQASRKYRLVYVALAFVVAYIAACAFKSDLIQLKEVVTFALVFIFGGYLGVQGGIDAIATKWGDKRNEGGSTGKPDSPHSTDIPRN